MEAPALHPLDILDDFLLSLSTAKNNNQKILEVSEFLYGKQAILHAPQKSSAAVGSILDSALEILDSFEEYYSPLPSSLIIASRKIPDTEQRQYIPSVPVRMLICKESGRRIILVRGSKGGSTPEYLCTLGRNKKPNENGRKLAAGRDGYHCSCRSFFERLKEDEFALCKHLLAARLAQFLNEADKFSDESEQGGNQSNNSRVYQEIEVEEEEFAQICAKVTILSWII